MEEVGSGHFVAVGGADAEAGDGGVAGIRGVEEGSVAVGREEGGVDAEFGDGQRDFFSKSFRVFSGIFLGIFFRVFLGGIF